MSVYKVLAGVYRGRRPGETFEAELDMRAELRAVNRGQIQVVSRSRTKVVKGSYRLPKARADEEGAGGVREPRRPRPSPRKGGAEAEREESQKTTRGGGRRKKGGADAHTDTDQGDRRHGA